MKLTSKMRIESRKRNKIKNKLKKLIFLLWILSILEKEFYHLACSNKR